MNRRHVLLGSAAAAAFLVTSQFLRGRRSGEALAETFEIDKSEDEWRKILTPEQFTVLRKEGTERAGSSLLDHEARKGIYHCAGCDLDVYSSAAKYDSGTGWPSFWETLPDAVRTKEDNSFFMTRTEVHCRRCGGHLGHIFDDGPPPTGKRHCINGVALNFKPATS